MALLGITTNSLLKKAQLQHRNQVFNTNHIIHKLQPRSSCYKARIFHSTHTLKRTKMPLNTYVKKSKHPKSLNSKKTIATYSNVSFSLP